MFISFTEFEANLATRSASGKSYGKRTFIKMLLFTCFSHVEAKFASCSEDRRSHGTPTFMKMLVFTSFPHFEGNCVTQSADRRSPVKATFMSHLCSPLSRVPSKCCDSKAAGRSHGKGRFITTLLFTSFPHFEAKVVTRSAH